jgi:sugar fermentation stimulation protein A
VRFPAPLIPATLVRRYKRFLADVVLPSSEEVTVHVANPGAMTGLAAPGARVWLSLSANPARKLRHSWELVEVDLGAGVELAGVNTAHPNLLVAEALRQDAIPELAGYGSLRREVKYGKGSRVDFLLEEPDRPPCWLEVKNVHLMREPGLAEFPDCVTARGAKHLEELAAMAAGGARAVMLYVIQIGSADRFALAGDIDPAYAAAFDRALAAGVEAIARRCAISAEAIVVSHAVPIIRRAPATAAQSLRRAAV